LGILSYVNRQPATLPGTIASLLNAFPRECPTVFPDDGRWGASLNLARALDELQKNSHDLMVCVLDDDLVLDLSARTRLLEAMQTYGNEAAFSLWTIEQNLPHDLRDTLGWVRVDAHMHLWGGAVVMSVERAARCAHLIRGFVKEDPTLGTKPDACLFMGLEKMRVPLYFHTPSLVDHVGLEASTIGNTHAHGETRGYKFGE
jgi:hypothetical protein